MSIASEITRINNNIASAYSECQSKGATMPTTQNSANLPNTIASISGGGGANLDDYFNRTIDSSSTSTLSWLQSSLIKKVPTLTIDNGITSLAYAFSRCSYTSIVFDGVDLTNITNATYMFASSSTVKSIDISNFTNTNQITNATYMFNGDTALETITGMFALTGTVDIRYCFRHCNELKKIDLSNWEITPSNANGTSIFENCYKAAIIDISKISFQSGFSYSSTFNNTGTQCLQSDGAYADGIPYVYVKDSSIQAKILQVKTTWSTSNVVVKSS